MCVTWSRSLFWNLSILPFFWQPLSGLVLQRRRQFRIQQPCLNVKRYCSRSKGCKHFRGFLPRPWSRFFADRDRGGQDPWGASGPLPGADCKRLWLAKLLFFGWWALRLKNLWIPARSLERDGDMGGWTSRRIQAVWRTFHFLGCWWSADRWLDRRGQFLGFHGFSIPGFSLATAPTVWPPGADLRCSWAGDVRAVDRLAWPALASFVGNARQPPDLSAPRPTWEGGAWMRTGEKEATYANSSPALNLLYQYISHT